MKYTVFLLFLTTAIVTGMDVCYLRIVWGKGGTFFAPVVGTYEECGNIRECANVMLNKWHVKRDYLGTTIIRNNDTFHGPDKYFGPISIWPMKYIPRCMCYQLIREPYYPKTCEVLSKCYSIIQEMWSNITTDMLWFDLQNN